MPLWHLARRIVSSCGVAIRYISESFEKIAYEDDPSKRRCASWVMDAAPFMQLDASSSTSLIISGGWDVEEPVMGGGTTVVWFSSFCCR